MKVGRDELVVVDSLDLPDEAATLRFGERLGQNARPGDFLGLVGQMGAGKTTFVKGFVAGRAPEEDVTSPTYTLVNTYDADVPIYHFDLWRLEDIDGLESIGYWDYLNDDAICLVEWLDRVDDAWPGHGQVVELTQVAGARRATLWALPIK